MINLGVRIYLGVMCNVAFCVISHISLTERIFKFQILYIYIVFEFSIYIYIYNHIYIF